VDLADKRVERDTLSESVAAVISRPSADKHENRSSAKNAWLAATQSARMTRRRSITSLHRLGSVAVQEQFAPVHPHRRRHHSFHGKGKRSNKNRRPTEGSYRVPSREYRIIRTCFPPCTARQRQWLQAYQGRLQTGMEIVAARNKQARRLPDARMA